VTPFRPLLHYPAVRLVLDTAAAVIVLSVGVEMIAHANGSTWAPLIGGPAITLAGAHLILLARVWNDQLRQASMARKNPAGSEPGPIPAEARSGAEQ
jgi:predicted tellurium resistance membrane protein TerC